MITESDRIVASIASNPSSLVDDKLFWNVLLIIPITSENPTTCYTPDKTRKRKKPTKNL
jgi:hypothetical protein